MPIITFVNKLDREGHDAVTVTSQGLRKAADERLFEGCKAESRALITLDRDFGQV